MRLVLTGGGTGGHITPALNVARELMECDSKAELLFIGRQGGKENDAVKKFGIRLTELEVYGIKRSLSPSNIKTAIADLRAIRKAKDILKEFKPDAVLGTGGYVCWPVITAAMRMNIPSAIHESNSCPGLVTRLLSKKCSAVLLGYDEAREHVKGARRIVTVGNPVDKALSRQSRLSARAELGLRVDEIFIVSFGGSGGAAVMNSAISELMEHVSSKDARIKHLHATGRAYFEKWNKRSLAGCKVVPYIDDMPKYLKAADIVISRCGAMAVSELSAVGAPSVLIPSPNVTNDHQRRNARILSDRGAAIVLEEAELPYGRLIETVRELSENRGLRDTLSRKIKALSDTSAAKNIIGVLKELSGES